MNIPAFTVPAPLGGKVLFASHSSASAALPNARLINVAPRFVASIARARRPENAEGNLYVDSTCIDCDTCRWLAPEIFHVDGAQSAVHTQPQNNEQQVKAMRAAAACPTGSIRTESPISASRQARASFPLPVSDALSPTPVPNVYYNGYSSSDSFGCASWLLIHPDGPEPYAVMFDCPRFFKPLAAKIKKLAEPVGGIKYIVLSHKDDVPGHAEWAEALGAQRIIHSDEVLEAQGTQNCEIKLSNSDFPYKLADGAELLHAPGHSVGSLMLLHHPTQSLFTGDHFAYYPRLQHLAGSTTYCTQSWSLQVDSVEKMVDIPFLHGWPGHRRHFHFKSDDERRTSIRQAANYMRTLECHLA